MKGKVKQMKKIIISSMVATTLLGIGVPTMQVAAAEQEDITSASQLNIDNSNVPEELKAIEPYVFKKEDGTIALRDMPDSLYDEYQIEYLEAHFSTLNNAVKSNKISITEDLEIVSLNRALTSWNYHWWGYDANFNNVDANDLKYTLLTVGSFAAAAGYFPPIGALGGLSAAYLGLIATRIDANNNGNGVYIGITWAAVFNIKPL